MPTQQTGWVTADQHFFSTQTEAENYEHLQRHFQNQFISTIDYDHNDGFVEYNNYTRAMVSVTPSLVVTLTSFKNPRSQGVSRFQSGEELVNSVGK